MQEWTFGNFRYDNNGSISETYLYPIAGGYYTGTSSYGQFLITVTESSTIKFSTSVVNESCSNLIISHLISYKSANYQKSSYISIEISKDENLYNDGARGSFSELSEHSPIGCNYHNTIRLPTYTPSSRSSYSGNSSSGQNGSFISDYYFIGAYFVIEYYHSLYLPK